jgi:hypothetical protein
MDEEIVGSDPPKSSFGLVVTTWHDSESLSAALDFFLSLTVVDETFAGECKSALIISVALPEMEQRGSASCLRFAARIESTTERQLPLK